MLCDETCGEHWVDWKVLNYTQIVNYILIFGNMLFQLGPSSYLGWWDGSEIWIKQLVLFGGKWLVKIGSENSISVSEFLQTIRDKSFDCKTLDKESHIKITRFYDFKFKGLKTVMHFWEWMKFITPWGDAWPFNFEIL